VGTPNMLWYFERIALGNKTVNSKGVNDERHRIIHEIAGDQKAMVYQGSEIWRFS
jgi:hypothetical protein